MKKLLFAIALFGAMMSCTSNKTSNVESVDSSLVDTIEFDTVDTIEICVD